MTKLKQWLAQPVRGPQTVVIALAGGFAFWLTLSAFSAATGPGAVDPMIDFGRLGAIFAAVLAPAGTELVKRWNLPKGLSPAVNGGLAILLYGVGWLLMTGGDSSVLGAYLAEALAVAGVSTMGASAMVSAREHRQMSRAADGVWREIREEIRHEHQVDSSPPETPDLEIDTDHEED